MKIFDLLLELDLDFFRFPKHKTGWGVRYPGQGIFTPTIYHRLTDKVNKKGTLAKLFISQVNLTEITLLITKVIIKKETFYFENSGGQDTQGRGEDIPGNFAPRGPSCPRVSSPPGGKLPRVQDKPVHRHYMCDFPESWVSVLSDKLNNLERGREIVFYVCLSILIPSGPAALLTLRILRISITSDCSTVISDKKVSVRFSKRGNSTSASSIVEILQNTHSKLLLFHLRQMHKLSVLHNGGIVAVLFCFPIILPIICQNFLLPISDLDNISSIVSLKVSLAFFFMLFT